MTYDSVFSDALVIDGSGRSAFHADVGIKDGTIVGMASPRTLKGKENIPCKDLVLAPGFIDFHSHADWIIPSTRQGDLLSPYLLQGITTFVGGNCGFSPFPVREEILEAAYQNAGFLTEEGFRFSWRDLPEFLHLAETDGLLLNYLPLTGHGNLRLFIRGKRPGSLHSDELQELRRLIRSAKAQGCFGISLGLAYVPGVFADSIELETIFQTAAEEGMIITIHGHTYSWTSPFFEDSSAHNVKDIRLFASLARKAGVRVHLSHMILKGERTWETLYSVIAEIDKAAAEGTDITFGVIPYHWGNTLINTLLPKWFLEDFDGNIMNQDAVGRLEKEISETERAIGRDLSDLYLLWGGAEQLRPLEGSSFREIADLKKMGDIDLIIWLMKESGGMAKILTASYSGREGEFDLPLEKLIVHDRAILEIDAIVTDAEGPQTPAAYGAFPKVLGRLSREKHLMSLEKAIHKMTGFPASRLELDGIGSIHIGAAADLVLFDPLTIQDTNSITDPCRKPNGVKSVWIGGSRVVEDGQIITDKRYGRIIRNKS